MLKAAMLSIYFIVAQFEQDFNLTVHTPITMVDTTDNNAQAICYHDYRHNKTFINVNYGHWKSLPYVHQRELIYHELGHCELDLRHAPRGTEAIMKAMSYSTKLDGSNWRKLVNKLERNKDKL